MVDSLSGLPQREQDEDFYRLCRMGPRDQAVCGNSAWHRRSGQPGATLDELRKNLKEVLELCLEEYKDFPEERRSFILDQNKEQTTGEKDANNKERIH